MRDVTETGRVETLIIGGGQAGLATGYHLKQRGLPFLIVDASERIGDAWRSRWTSLRLFTPARYSALPGMPFPAAAPHTFPSKDAMADYLAAYAERMELPVHSGVRVERLTREGGRFVAEARSLAGDALRLEADQVVVAMSNWQEPRVPDFAAELDDAIVQLHTKDYRAPDQLRDGPVLVVGAGNSGAEIALDLADRHTIWLSGRDVGAIPFRIEGLFGRLIGVRFVLRVLFHRLATVNTPIGRKMRQDVFEKGGPLVRTKPRDLDAAGVRRVPRTAGARDGRPVIEDGRALDVANVIWCTGFRSGFDRWIDLPVLDDDLPVHDLGRAVDQPGLYFVGMPFIYAASSEMVHGVGRDGERIAGFVAAHRGDARRAKSPGTRGRQPAGRKVEAVG